MIPDLSDGQVFVLALIGLLALSTGLVVLWDEWRRRQSAPYHLGSAGEAVAAACVTGQSRTATYDPKQDAWIEATRHPSGAIRVKVIPAELWGERLAEELGEWMAS